MRMASDGSVDLTRAIVGSSPAAATGRARPIPASAIKMDQMARY